MQRKYKILLYAVLLTLPLLLVQCGGGREEPTPTLSPPTATPVPTVPPTPTPIPAEPTDTPAPVEASSSESAEGDGASVEEAAYPAPEGDGGETSDGTEAAAEEEVNASKDAENAEATEDGAEAATESTTEEATVEEEAYPEPAEETTTEAASEEAACPSVFSINEPVYSNLTNITGTGPAGTEILITSDETEEDEVLYNPLGEGVIAEDGTFDIELTTPLEPTMFIGIQLASWDETDATNGVLDQLMTCKGNTAVINEDPALTLWDATFVVAQ